MIRWTDELVINESKKNLKQEQNLQENQILHINIQKDII